MYGIKLITIEAFNGRPEEFVYAGNELAATSTINKALQDGVPTMLIQVWEGTSEGTLQRVDFEATKVIPKPRYRITFEGEQS